VTGRYTVLLTRPARGALAEFLPPVVAAAAWELITGALPDDPWRVGKPLHDPYEGLHAARRGTYRILYTIDEDKRAIEIRSTRHRADAYRT
jgi:mRNA interferase RelE/StbE